MPAKGIPGHPQHISRGRIDEAPAALWGGWSFVIPEVVERLVIGYSVRDPVYMAADRPFDRSMSLSNLSEVQRVEAMRRWRLLRPHLHDQMPLSWVAERTLRRWLAAYRRHGFSVRSGGCVRIEVIAGCGTNCCY